MLVLWGTYELARTATGPVARCEFCGQDAVDNQVHERVGHFFFAPLVPRKFRAVSACSHCQRVRVTKLARGLGPRRIMTARIAIAWALIGLMIAIGVIGEFVTHGLARERAIAPFVGDQWTIDTEAWRELGADMVPTALRYMRARVDAVADGGVTVSTCGFTAERQDTIERKCDSFPNPIGTLDAAELARMRDADVIVAVWRGGRDPMGTFFGAIGALAVALIGYGLWTRRWVKRRTFEGPPVPEARVLSS
ncbi:MAG: hypothetical protein K8W52_31595 [Deltaproteobacteria bacterium]|nr:hypothetical protein [Deltaproteobacteria bacterium]